MQCQIHSHIIFRCQEEEHAKARFSRSSALNSSISTLASSSNRRHYASYLPMTGQIDLIEEEIVLTHKVQNENEKKQKQNSVAYPQPLSHNTDNDMGD